MLSFPPPSPSIKREIVWQTCKGDVLRGGRVGAYSWCCIDSEFRTPICETIFFLTWEELKKDEVCHYTYRALERCQTIEVGDFEFDGMQGDTAACGQHWQTFKSIFFHKEPLKFEGNLKREFAETWICNTIWSFLYTCACMFIKADKQQRIQAKM